MARGSCILHSVREEVVEMSTFADGGQSVAAATAATEALTGSSTVVAATNGGKGELAEDGYPKDMEIPVRYVKGMEGDMVEARRRWIATLKVNVLSRCLRSSQSRRSLSAQSACRCTDGPLSVEEGKAGAIQQLCSKRPHVCCICDSL